MWRWMSDQGGYSIAMRIKQGCDACEERARLKEISVSKMLRDLGKRWQFLSSFFSLSLSLSLFCSNIEL
jgi:hypothetical protein